MTWRRLAVLVVSATATVVACDLLLQRVAPLPPRIREVNDGVLEYETSDPDTLVLGSSHARSFVPMADLLALRSNGRHKMLVVPVEWGTFSSYNWVLQNRLRPLIEERDPAGRPARGRLSRALLVTTFYDMCPKEHSGSGTNLPARAWALRHFIDDASRHGLTDLNRNYLQTRWKRLWSGSMLVQDRGYDRIQRGLRQLVRGEDPEEGQREFLDWSRRHMEEQYAYCDDDLEGQQLVEMLDYFQTRKVEVTVVLFPLMPAIVSETSRQTTVKRYAERIGSLHQERPFRVAEMTFGTPLVDGDFAADADHVRPEGNVKFVAWALDHDLRHLEEPLDESVSRLAGAMDEPQAGYAAGFTPAAGRRRSPPRGPMKEHDP